jgi:hypothetical protein
MTEKLQNAQPAAEQHKHGFRPLSGLIERIRGGRERSRTLSLLGSSLRSGVDGGAQFEEALAAFKGLPSQDKDKALSGAAEMFSPYSSFTFESEQKTASMTTLSVFVAEAAALMNGCEIRSRAGLIRELKALSKDDALYDHGSNEHAGAKLAAAVALWELGYMEYPFWEDRLSCPATRDFTIAKMLEMPQYGEYKEHGWHLLQKNLTSDLAMWIALSGSPKKADFLTSMLLDNDTRTVVAALEGAIYLHPLPADFLDMAAEAAGRSAELRVKAGYFISAAKARPYIELPGDNQYSASSHLIVLYMEGMRHLAPLLSGVVLEEMRDVYHDPPGASDEAKEAERAKAAVVILQLHMAGIRTDGFIFKKTDG